MARLNDTTVSGVVTQTSAATDPEHLVRKGEMDGLLYGKADVGHTHIAGDIVDLPDAFKILLRDSVGDSTSAAWEQRDGLLYANVRMASGGRIAVGSDGLFVVVDDISLAGHTHLAVDITDLPGTIASRMAQIVRDTDTIQWESSGVLLYATARLKTNGGLLEDPDGIYVDLGSGVNQAARGNHSHAQLHDALTLAPSVSIDATLDVQQLSMEVRVTPNGGLKLNSGVEADFGGGTNQVSRGDHTHDEFHPPVTVRDTLSLALRIDPSDGDASQLLYGSVRLAGDLGAGYAPLEEGFGGLFLRLGTGASQPAAGNHTHPVATQVSDGFMSAADKIIFDAINTRVFSGTNVQVMSFHMDGYGSPLPPGTTAYFVAPWGGTIRDWTVVADAVGHVNLDVWRVAYDDFPPDSGGGDTIAGTEHPILSGVQLARNNTLTTWTREFGAGDVFAVKVLTATTIKSADLFLKVELL